MQVIVQHLDLLLYSSYTLRRDQLATRVVTGTRPVPPPVGSPWNGVIWAAVPGQLPHLIHFTVLFGLIIVRTNLWRLKGKNCINLGTCVVVQTILCVLNESKWGLRIVVIHTALLFFWELLLVAIQSMIMHVWLLCEVYLFDTQQLYVYHVVVTGWLCMDNRTNYCLFDAQQLYVYHVVVTGWFCMDNRTNYCFFLPAASAMYSTTKLNLG